MSDKTVACECPFCRCQLAIRAGSTAFIYSQVGLHLIRCPRRLSGTRAEIWLIAERLTSEAIGRDLWEPEDSLFLMP